MSTNEHLGVISGRFQIPHHSHFEVMKQAASQCDRLMILIGSVNQRSSIKNPLSYSERKDAIIKSLYDMNVFNIMVEPMNDYKYSDAQWCSDLRQTVKTRQVTDGDITLFGHHKDETSYYLDLFGEWKSVELNSRDGKLSSTDLRKIWFECRQDVNAELKKNVPHHVQRLLENRAFDADLQADWEYYKSEKITFQGYPYPETLNFNCSDCIIECAGNILLIKRARAPGKNTWALPGGFKNRNETFFDCAVREGYEETNIRIPEKSFRKSMVSGHMFDSPNRSFGINRNTFAFHFKVELNHDGSLPRANGMDDALETRWVPIDEVMNDYVLYDDHKDIISYFTGAKQIPAFLSI